MVSAQSVRVFWKAWAWRSRVAVFLVAAACCLAGRAASAELDSRLLFDSGKEGYARYRIPCLIVTQKGTTLAICEGRKDGGGLAGNIDIVVKRSTDSGRIWQPLEKIADDDGHTLGNPCAVVDQPSGTIWLALTRSHGQDTEPEIVAGLSRETTRVLLTTSSDDGRTWAPLRDITSACKKDDWTWYGTGPGIGIQLTSGRLLIPCYHAEHDSKIYRSHAIYSDDHGKTWRRGEAVGRFCGECQAVQRRDGSLLLSSRTNKGPLLRTQSTSIDEGKTWAKAIYNEALFDPHCQASLYPVPTADGDAPLWLYTHPAGPTRHNLTVRLSRDEGRTWPVARLLRAGDSQYSCMALLPDGAIGCLYDCWVDGNYRLFFVRFTIDWLTAAQ